MNARERSDNMQKSMDMLQGSLWDKILKFSMPVAATAILEQFFTATDVVIVGNFANGDKTAAMAAVGTDLQIIALVIFLFLGLALGANVLIAQAIGRQNREGVQKAVHTAVLLSVLAGIAVAVLGQFLAAPVLELMEIPPDVLPAAEMYLKIYFSGMPVILLYNFEAAIFRSIGETQFPLKALIVASLVNIVLDLFFVCVCKLDVTGVAIATVIANVVCAFMLLYVLLKTEAAIRLEYSKLRIDMPVLQQIIQIGLPAGIQSAVFNLANVVIQGAINSLGTKVIAASSASLLFEMVAYSIFSSFTQACTTFVGQNYGGRQLTRCRKILRLCLLEDGLCTGACIIIMVCFGDKLIGLISDDSEVIILGYARAATVFFAYIFSFAYDVMSGYMRGFGISFLPSVLTILGVCGVRLAWVAYVFPVHHDFQSLMYVYPVSLGVTAFLIFGALMWCRPTKRFS